MDGRAVARLSPIALGAILLALVSSCGGSSPTAPTPTPQSETFTGTLQPLGTDFKTFSVVYAQSATDLSVTVNSLTTVANATGVTGITIGVGFGAVSGSTCALQIQSPVATLGQELFAPNGAGPGLYCVQIFDCPTGASGCTPQLTEAVNYSMTVKHY
jgi:hypothetical protein